MRAKLIAGAATIAVAVLAAFGGVLYGRWTAPRPAGQPPKVKVDTLWMEQQRPQLERPSLGQKIATKAVKPEQVLVADAPSAAGVAAVRRYCDSAPTAPVHSQPPASDEGGNQLHAPAPDTGITQLHNPVIAPVAVLPDFRGSRAGPRLELFSTLSDGRRWSWAGTARGRVTWQSSGDSVLVREDRLWTRIVRGTPKCGAFGLAGSAAGVVTGQSLRESAVTGLLTALGCAF